MAQSFFQVGGNTGSAAGFPCSPLSSSLPRGQRAGVALFSMVALLGIIVLSGVSAWYERARVAQTGSRTIASPVRPTLSRGRIVLSISILGALIFSKYFYLASLVSYYTFYLISRFGLPVRTAQIYLFGFLGAVAAGSSRGGPVGYRLGRKYVIWASILGVLPFTLILPHANLFWTGVLSVIIGLILASAFSAILVYAQELIPGRIGMISGLFFGFAFGMGGLGAAALGRLADATSITFVYQVCAFLPAIGMLTAFLPNLEKRRP